MTDAIRGQARKRTPQLAIACVVAGLALAPVGIRPVLLAAAIAGVGAACLFGPRRIAIGSDELARDRAGRTEGTAIARAGRTEGTAIARAGRIEGTAIARAGRIDFAPIAFAAALVLGAGLVGALRLAAIDRPAHAAPPGTSIDAVATLLERPRVGLFGSSAPMEIESGPARGLKILARRSVAEWPAVDPGVRFRVRGFVRQSGAAPVSAGGSATEANAGKPGTPGFGPLPPRPAPGDDFDFAAFLRSRGIGREVTVESLTAIGRRGGVASFVDSMRRRAERGISAGLPAEVAALARGMVLGEDGDIPDTTRDDFRRSGLAHLVAASGQNVALLCALALPILMLAGASQRVRIAVLLPLIGIYVALAGAGASITRAGITAAAGLIAIAAGRASSAVYALLLAAAITLALNPRATGDPGWQLSFAAVAGMLLLGPVVQRPLRRLPRFAAEAIGATVAATIATAPLLAHEFGAVSIAALPANIVAFPAVAPIMWIGMGEAAAEQLAGLGPMTGVAHALDAAVAPISHIALRWVAGTATRFADPAWAQAPIHLGWGVVGAAYLAIAMAAIAAGRIRRLKIPAGDFVDWMRALSPASRRAYAAPLVALAIAAGAHAATPPSPPRHLTVDFIDVGQGDATLIRDPTGAAVLFDGGVPEARVDRRLRRLGVRRLSVVVATHQSRDHHGGLLQVVKRFRVGLFLDGRDGVRDPSFFALEREVDQRRIPRRPVQAGERLTVGGMRIRFLWPTPRTAATPSGDPNMRAAVAIVSEGGFDLFLSADAESPVLLPLDLPRVDAMKVPHHGSDDPGLPQLLDRLRPRVATIMTGRGNPYRHPRPSTLDALRSRVPRVYRTDRDGTVELTVSGDRIAIRTHR